MGREERKRKQNEQVKINMLQFADERENDEPLCLLAALNRSIKYRAVGRYLILHCTVLYCTVLYCTVLYCAVSTFCQRVLVLLLHLLQILFR
jgi:hypothetical protein